MNYAIIENGVVTNLIWLSATNAEEFVDAVALGDRPVAMGDTYDGTHFYRAGNRVRTVEEQLRQEIGELDAALLDAEYQNLIGGLEA